MENSFRKLFFIFEFSNGILFLKIIENCLRKHCQLGHYIFGASIVWWFIAASSCLPRHLPWFVVMKYEFPFFFFFNYYFDIVLINLLRSYASDYGFWFPCHLSDWQRVISFIRSSWNIKFADCLSYLTVWARGPWAPWLWEEGDHWPSDGSTYKPPTSN